MQRNKTWSSVSNSSLSKTLALCQFRKLKVQKLCFLPPNIVLGLKKNQSKHYFGSEKNFDPEKIQVKKKFGSEKMLVGKNFGSEKILGSKKILEPNFCLKKDFRSRENFGSEKHLGLKKNLVGKKFGPEKNLGLKKFWVQKILLLFLFFL